MKPRVLLAAGATAIAACIGLVTAPAALAAPAASYPHVVVADASGSQLVFAKKTTGSTFTANSGGSLYSQNTAGDRTKLSTFSASSPVQVNAGSLIQTSSGSVHWRDLVSGAEGHASVASDEQVVTPAPTGWVEKRSTPDADPGLVGIHYALSWVTTSGARTDLGHPFSQDTINFTTKDGPTGLIAYTNNALSLHGWSGVAYMPWSTPGTWKVLYFDTDGADLYCAAPSSKAVACENRNPTYRLATHGMGVYPLDGSKATWLADKHPTACQKLNIVTVGSALVGVATTNAGSCTLGKVSRFGLDGTLTTSSRVYSTHGISAGLGGILAGSASQRSIVYLSTATSTPKFIVTS